MSTACFTQGAIWDIDSFDQWGVNWARYSPVRIIKELERMKTPELHHDGSTNALIERYRGLRGGA